VRSCRGGFGGGRELEAGLGEFPFQLRQGPRGRCCAGDHEEVAIRRDPGLLVAEYLAKPAFGPVAKDCSAHGGGRSDDANPGRDWRRIPAGGGQGAVTWDRLAPFPPDGECPTIHSATALPDRPDITLPAQMLLEAESHGPGNSGVYS
jgi:hypothetical protein